MRTAHAIQRSLLHRVPHCTRVFSYVRGVEPNHHDGGLVAPANPPTGDANGDCAMPLQRRLTCDRALLSRRSSRNTSRRTT
jgi:hypothetical protein